VPQRSSAGVERQTGPVISLELARRLRAAGLKWSPTSGDRFVVADRGMDGDVFVVSDMTVEVHNLPHGSVIGFNGTVEWALDSVNSDEAIWLPRETQLRELLGGTFRALERTAAGYRLHTVINGTEIVTEDADPEQAYGLALLRLLDAIAG
jgi:hypothetical protein